MSTPIIPRRLSHSDFIGGRLIIIPGDITIITAMKATGHITVADMADTAAMGADTTNGKFSDFRYPSDQFVFIDVGQPQGAPDQGYYSVTKSRDWQWLSSKTSERIK